MSIDVMNGWKAAPHCWKTYLTRPIKFESTPIWFCVSFFGFAIFFCPEKKNG